MEKETGLQRHFKGLVLEKYNSMAEFARTVHVDPNNIRRNLNGTDIAQLDRLFKYANALNMDIVDMLWLFYPEKMRENRPWENPYNY